MYRRRPRRHQIEFSFDSFLDVVANVIGIVVRLILVAWVGARSYTAAMQLAAETAPVEATATASPTTADDPLSPELEKIRRELVDARRRLLEQLGKLQLADQETSETRTQLAELAKQHDALTAEANRVGVELAGKGAKVRTVLASADELKRRGDEVLKQIKALEKLPPQKQVLRYHTPVSRVVHADEMFFECRHGRVTYIDLPAFMQEIRASLEDKVDALKTQWRVTAVTSAVGAFRLRYIVEREKSGLDSLGGGPSGSGFRYGLSAWSAEAITEERGETLEAALRPNSQFRRLVDRLDSRITVVTFWVYPDSFAQFRRLRDHLYERDVEVAGRPLTEGAQIAARGMARRRADSRIAPPSPGASPRALGMAVADAASVGVGRADAGSVGHGHPQGSRTRPGAWWLY